MHVSIGERQLGLENFGVLRGAEKKKCARVRHESAKMGQGQTKLSLEEQMKLHQKTIKKACRELETEKRHLERAEQKTILEMKNLAKQNQVNSVKIMAKDLVRCRKYQSKFLEMKAQLQGVSLQLQTMKSQEAMTRSMKGITKVMIQMNSKMDAKTITKIMQEFMTENERQKMNQEVMSEAIDDAMEDDEVEEDAIVNQVLDEIGIEMSGDMINNTGVGKISTRAPATAAECASGQAQAEPAGGPQEDSLEARLNALKR